MNIVRAETNRLIQLLYSISCKSIFLRLIQWLIRCHHWHLIGLDIKVCEEDQEENGVGADPVCKMNRIVAVDEKQLGCVDANQKKLCNLHRCHVLLPPKVLLIARTHGRHAVVNIHDKVDEGIHPCVKCSKTTWNKLHSKPPRHWHNTVMKNVKKANLIVLLT